MLRGTRTNPHISCPWTGQKVVRIAPGYTSNYGKKGGAGLGRGFSSSN